MFPSLIAVVLIQASTHPALQSLRSTFGPKKDFEADFNQTIEQDLFPESPDKATGKFIFKRPNKMKWYYETPKPKLIEFDGEKITIVEGKRKEVQPSAGQVTLEQSFSFLWGEPDPKIFKIENVDSKTFRVIPLKKDEVTFKHIDVRVDAGKVTSAKIFDKLGSTSLLTFKWK